MNSNTIPVCRFHGAPMDLICSCDGSLYCVYCFSFAHSIHFGHQIAGRVEEPGFLEYLSHHLIQELPLLEKLCEYKDIESTWEKTNNAISLQFEKLHIFLDHAKDRALARAKELCMEKDFDSASVAASATQCCGTLKDAIGKLKNDTTMRASASASTSSLFSTSTSSSSSTGKQPKNIKAQFQSFESELQSFMNAVSEYNSVINNSNSSFSSSSLVSVDQSSYDHLLKLFSALPVSFSNSTSEESETKLPSLSFNLASFLQTYLDGGSKKEKTTATQPYNGQKQATVPTTLPSSSSRVSHNDQSSSTLGTSPPPPTSFSSHSNRMDSSPSKSKKSFSFTLSLSPKKSFPPVAPGTSPITSKLQQPRISSASKPKSYTTSSPLSSNTTRNKLLCSSPSLLKVPSTFIFSPSSYSNSHQEPSPIFSANDEKAPPSKIPRFSPCESVSTKKRILSSSSSLPKFSLHTTPPTKIGTASTNSPPRIVQPSSSSQPSASSPSPPSSPPSSPSSSSIPKNSQKNSSLTTTLNITSPSKIPFPPSPTSAASSPSKLTSSKPLSPSKIPMASSAYHSPSTSPSYSNSHINTLLRENEGEERSTIHIDLRNDINNNNDEDDKNNNIDDDDIETVILPDETKNFQNKNKSTIGTLCAKSSTSPSSSSPRLRGLQYAGRRKSLINDKTSTRSGDGNTIATINSNSNSNSKSVGSVSPPSPSSPSSLIPVFTAPSTFVSSHMRATHSSLSRQQQYYLNENRFTPNRKRSLSCSRNASLSSPFLPSTSMDVLQTSSTSSTPAASAILVDDPLFRIAKAKKLYQRVYAMDDTDIALLHTGTMSEKSGDLTPRRMMAKWAEITAKPRDTDTWKWRISKHFTLLPISPPSEFMGPGKYF